MDEREVNLDRLIANLMVFYKGALTYEALQKMPIPELLVLRDEADRINKEVARKQKSGF